MKTISMNNVTIFANQFVSTIMEENDLCSSGYEWEMSYDIQYNEDIDELYSKALLSLYDGDGNAVGSMAYDIIRDNKCRYTYITSLLFDDEILIDTSLEDLLQYTKIEKTINLVEAGLFDKICAYLHKCAIEQIHSCEHFDYGWPPSYEAYCSPSSVESFIREYRLSKYVPMVFEVVDEKGLPIKHLDIVSLGYNDEGNTLIISLKE